MSLIVVLFGSGDFLAAFHEGFNAESLFLCWREGGLSMKKMALLANAGDFVLYRGFYRTVKGKWGDLRSSGEVEWLHYTIF